MRHRALDKNRRTQHGSAVQITSPLPLILQLDRRDYQELEFTDHVVVGWAEEQLAAEHGKPFFLAVGFCHANVPSVAGRKRFMPTSPLFAGPTIFAVTPTRYSVSTTRHLRRVINFANQCVEPIHLNGLGQLFRKS